MKLSDRYFKVRDTYVCKKVSSDGRLAMLALNSDSCKFEVQPYYFGIFFRNSDWVIEEFTELAFKQAVIKECGVFPELKI